MQKLAKFNFKHWLFIALTIFVIDTFAKYHLHSIVNTGISFGLASGIVNYVWLIIYFCILTLAVSAWYKHKDKNALVLIALFIISFSNILDRMIWGGVRDYLAVLNLQLNLTDIVINVFVIYIMYLFVSEQK